MGWGSEARGQLSSFGAFHRCPTRLVVPGVGTGIRAGERSPEGGPKRFRPKSAFKGGTHEKVLLTVTLALRRARTGEITLYGREGFAGRSASFRAPVRNLEREGFANGRRRPSFASFLRAMRRPRVRGPLRGARPRPLPESRGHRLNDAVSRCAQRRAGARSGGNHPNGRENFEGRSLPRAIGSQFGAARFQLSRLLGHRRGRPLRNLRGRGFEGSCRVLRPGQYRRSRNGITMRSRSVRTVARQASSRNAAFAPPPPVAYDNRAVAARSGYSTRQSWPSGPSTATGAALAGWSASRFRAVGATPQRHRRCHHRRHPLPPVGSGRGNDAATAAGAVAGAAIGSRHGGTTYSRDVQRCSQPQVSGPPQYWDVTYRFRGVDRTMQMTRPPGATISVNRDGEPRAG